jgi:hypothetical protein
MVVAFVPALMPNVNPMHASKTMIALPMFPLDIPKNLADMVKSS